MSTTPPIPVPAGLSAAPAQPKDSAQGWLVVAAAFIGMLLSMGVLVVYSYGVLTSSMAAEFGWSTMQRSTLFAVFSLSATVCGPMWGALADRIGARKVALSSIVLLAVSLFSLRALPNNLVLAHLAFFLLGVLGSGTLPQTYASVVVGWFDRRRGLALGVAMIGVGVGAAAAPAIAARIASEQGWRQLCVMYSLMVLLISLPVALLFLRQFPEEKRQAGISSGSNWAQVAAAFRQSRTWILAVFAFTTGAFLLAGVTNFVPLLQSRGETLVSAAKFQSLLGVALILGRLVGGALIDRIFAPRVVTAVLVVTAAGFFVLRDASSPFAYSMAAIGIGLAIGTEVDFLAFIVSRYYDRSVFTTIFAVLFATYALGAAAGPPTFSWLVQASGGHQLSLLACAALSFMLALLMFALPRYEAVRR